MDVVVPDASVLLKWVLPGENEAYRAQALALRHAIVFRQVEVRVPALWYFEVGNTLARKYPQDAAGRLADLNSFRLPVVSVDSAMEKRILLLTAKFNVTFYDAAYHALAIVHQGVFVTADEKYLNVVAFEPHVMHLKDWR